MTLISFLEKHRLDAWKHAVLCVLRMLVGQQFLGVHPPY